MVLWRINSELIAVCWDNRKTLVRNSSYSFNQFFQHILSIVSISSLCHKFAGRWLVNSIKERANQKKKRSISDFSKNMYKQIFLFSICRPRQIRIMKHQDPFISLNLAPLFSAITTVCNTLYRVFNIFYSI